MTTHLKVSTEHHSRLTPGIDRLAGIADRLSTARGVDAGTAGTDAGTSAAGLTEQLDEACAFLTGLLLPHMEAAERVLYPDLERLMQNRHSMTPMRREHETIRRLIADVDGRRRRLVHGGLSMVDTLALRRSLFQLHALLKVHLAEEQLYADLVEHGLSPEMEQSLAVAMRHEGIGAA